MRPPAQTVEQGGRRYWRSARDMARAQAKYDDMIKDALKREARKAAENSYSPYSKFRVGAACCDANGAMFRGTNVENGSYGLTICAERVAIFNAVAAGVREIDRMHVMTLDKCRTFSPCGACRQVMREFMADDALVDIDGVGTWQMSELLPLKFNL